jgi:hypothetical protein
MALTYSSVLRQVAITTNALAGTATPAGLNTAYNTVPLTIANFNATTGSAVFPFNFLKDKILNAQEALFMALAFTAANPLRGFIESQTDALTYGASILVNAAALPVVGAYGAVRDAESGEPCTLNELEQIRLRHLASSWMILQVYEYAVLDKRVYHTREEVIVDVCAYTRPDTDTLDLTSNILLPDILGPAIVQGAISECFRDDEYMEQAAQAGAIYSGWLTALKAGLSEVRPQSNPTPDAQKAYTAI